MFSSKRLLALFSPLLILLLSGGYTSAGTMEEYQGHVTFWIAGSDCYIEGSTGDAYKEVSHNSFLMQFDPGWPPQSGTQLTYVKVNLFYDDTKWEFVDAFKTDKWPGDFDKVNCGGGHIGLVFSGEGINPPHDCWQEGELAEIQLRSRCQPQYPGSLDYHAIAFDPNSANNYAMISYIDHGVIHTDCYYPTSKSDGYLFVYPPKHEFTIDNETQGLLGDIVAVPVTAETDTRLFSTNQFVNFNHEQLQIINVIPNPVVFPYLGNKWYWHFNSADQIEVYLVNQSPAWPLDWISPLTAATELYSVQCRILGEQDNTQIPLTFSQAECFDTSWNLWRVSGEVCRIFEASINPPEVNPGQIIIPPYTAELICRLNGPYIAKSVGQYQSVSFNVLLENSFPLGDYSNLNNNGGIAALYDMPSCLTFSNIAEDPDDPDFHGETYINGERVLYTYQEYNSAPQIDYYGPNPASVPIYTMTFLLDNNLIPISYEDRTFTLPFRNDFVNPSHDWHTFAQDTTGHVDATPANGKLTLTSIPAEVKMGEFFARAATSSTRSITQKLYVRATVDMGAFSVKVSVGNNFTLSSVIAANGASDEHISYNMHRIYFNGTNFHAATGDDSVLAATITYSAYCPYYKTSAQYPGGPYPVSAAVTFTEAFLNDYSGNGHFVDLTPGTVTGTCPGREIVDPEPNDIISKYDVGGIPFEYGLHPNVPNPFNPETAISYDVPAASAVRIEVVNILGQHVATLVDAVKAPGRYEVTWNGTDGNGAKVCSGIYLCCMQAGDYRQTMKMMLMK